MKQPLVKTFDVFDTVITRIVDRSVDVFLVAGHRLADEGLIDDAEAFAETRERAELAARHKSQREEITLGDIYVLLAEGYGWSEAEATRAAEIEIAAEGEVVRPVARMLTEVESASAAGRAPVFISDMYLSAETIASLLSVAGLEAPAGRIFVSSEHGRTKAKGGLFPIVAKALEPSGIEEHAGDNQHSDVRQARRAGWPARHVALSARTRFERRLGEGAALRAVRSAAAGAARAARLSFAAQAGHEEVLAATGANVFGPLLAGFVLRVLIDARRRGQNRLYFIARDGQIMLEVARALGPWAGEGLDLRYLYGSRQAWHLPALGAEGAWPGWVRENAAEATIGRILRRLGLDAERAEPLLRAAGLGRRDLEMPIGREGRLAEALRSLLAMPELRALAGAASAEAFDLLTDYLYAEGFGQGPAHIVDIGWNGRMQASLASVLERDRRFQGIRLTGSYLGLSTAVPREIRSAAYSYLSEGDDAPGAAALHRNRFLAEIMCRADHGGTIGFVRTEGGVAPRLADHDTAADQRWGLQAQRAGIIAFAAHLAEAARLLRVSPEDLADHLQAAAPRNWAAFTDRPTTAEAEVFGVRRHGKDQIHDEGEETAPALGVGRLGAALVLPPRRSLSITTWPEGSAVRSRPAWAAPFWHGLFAARGVGLHVYRRALLRRLKS